MDAPRRVALLARRAPVLVQHRVDERRHRVQLGLGPLRIAVRRRQRARDRLAHHPAVHAELGRHALDRTDAELVLTAKLLEQFHFGFPVHSRPPGTTGLTVG